VTENRVLEAGVDWASASNRRTVAMESVGTEFINGTAAESGGEAAEAATEKMLGSWRRAIRCPEVVGSGQPALVQAGRIPLERYTLR
jgi:hypothetical protein